MRAVITTFSRREKSVIIKRTFVRGPKRHIRARARAEARISPTSVVRAIGPRGVFECAIGTQFV